MAQATEHRSFEQSDEVREFPHGRAEILKVGGVEIGRLVFEPGWRWSNDVKPVAGTDSCTERSPTAWWSSPSAGYRHRDASSMWAAGPAMSCASSPHGYQGRENSSALIRHRR